ALRHARAIFERDMPEPSLVGPQADARSNLGRQNRHVSSRAQHALNFLLGDQAAADHQDLVAFELEKNGIERHSSSYPSSPWGTRPGEGSRKTGGRSWPARNVRSAVSGWRAKNWRRFSPPRRFSR